MDPYYPGSYYIQDKDLTFKKLCNPKNKHWEQLFFSLKTQEFKYIDLIHEEDRSAFKNEIAHLSIEKNPLEYRWHDPATKELIYIQDYRRTILNTKGQLSHYEGILIDNTRCAIAEKRLAQAAWKESVATITSGLIHDFSNVIAGIYSISELYHSMLDKDNSMHEGLAQIKKSSIDARELVRKIIDLNREESGRKSYHNLEKILNDQIQFIHAIMPKQTKLKINLTGKEIPVYLDDVLFKQTILNMAINARDAITHQNGQIEISVESVKIGDTPFESSQKPFIVPQEGAIIKFNDNGCGIPQEHIEKIFSPFFSTKESTKGSGLGLYNAKHFIEECSGTLKVESEINKGSTFYIYLPKTQLCENEKKQQIVESSKPSVVIYSSKDSSTFDIISLLQKKDWSLISFNNVETLKEYLKETKYIPNAFHSIDIGEDSNIEAVINYLKQEYPDIKRTLQVLGRNPDEISSRLKKDVDRLFDTTSLTQDIAQSLSELIT